MYQNCNTDYTNVQSQLTNAVDDQLTNMSIN